MIHLRPISIALLAWQPGWVWQPQIAHFSRNDRVLALDPPGACVEVFEDAAHTLFTDPPERFNRLLDEFARARYAAT